MEIVGNKGLVTEIYKGKDKVWEMHEIMIDKLTTYPNSKSISVKAYPPGVDITMNI